PQGDQRTTIGRVGSGGRDARSSRTSCENSFFSASPEILRGTRSRSSGRPADRAGSHLVAPLRAPLDVEPRESLGGQRTTPKCLRVQAFIRSPQATTPADAGWALQPAGSRSIDPRASPRV